MMVRYVLTIFLLLLFCLCGLSAATKTAFDSVVDFNLAIENLTPESSVTTDKIILIDGTMSVIYPQVAFAFLPQVEEFRDPAGFLKVLGNPDNKLSAHLVSLLSAKNKKALEEGERNSSLLKTIIDDLNRSLRKDSIYSPPRFAAVSLPAFVKELLVAEKNEEESAFVNRLLLDAAYSAYLNPVSMRVEIVKGIWEGYTSVKNFRVQISFQGPECFKFFSRRKITDASRYMISLNSRILVAAKPDKIIAHENGGKVWLLEGLYVRELK